MSKPTILMVGDTQMEQVMRTFPEDLARTRTLAKRSTNVVRESSAMLVVIAILAAAASFPLAVTSAAAQTANERMQDAGPEAALLARRAGEWSVVMTLRPTPDAAPIVTKGLIAQRTMIGLFLQEVLHPGPTANSPDFQLISYLTYNRVEGGWQYVSMSTLFHAGIMPAWSFGDEADGKLMLRFRDLAFVGFGDEVEGRMTHANYVLTRRDIDHERVEQYWVQSNGSGRQWLAVEYEYTRTR